jgi:LysR family transcriptional regulator for bpeEF and oprC
MAIHKLRALEYLVCVVEQGGFNAAARKLGVAAPSVHRSVTALETTLQTQLLDRATTPIVPTPEGVAYVERARRLLGELNELDGSLRDDSRTPSGTVVVAAQNVALQFVIAKSLPRFHLQYPSVRIDLIEAGTMRDVSRLKADVLVQFGWPPKQEAILRTLTHTRWLVAASPSFWARHGVPHHPAELSRYPCVLFRTGYGEILRRWTFKRGGERIDVDVDGWLTCDNRVAMDEAVFEGQVVARMNDLTTMDALRAGKLQPVLLDWLALHSPPLNLLIRKAGARQPRVRAWIDFLAQEVAATSRSRLPAGLPPVLPTEIPSWFKRRVG